MPRAPLRATVFMKLAETRHYVAQTESQRLFELVVGTGAGLAVGAPTVELGGVPKPPTLHVVVAALDHQLRPQRVEGEVLAGVPSGVLVLARGALAGFVGGPIPRVVLEAG